MKKKHEEPLKAESAEAKKAIIAKKSFTLVQNDVHIIIKEGDDLSRVPQRFFANLKTEGVI